MHGLETIIKLNEEVVANRKRHMSDSNIRLNITCLETELEDLTVVFEAAKERIWLDIIDVQDNCCFHTSTEVLLADNSETCLICGKRLR